MVLSNKGAGICYTGIVQSKNKWVHCKNQKLSLEQKAYTRHFMSTQITNPRYQGLPVENQSVMLHNCMPMMHQAQKNHVAMGLRKLALQVLLLSNHTPPPQKTGVVW